MIRQQDHLHANSTDRRMYSFAISEGTPAAMFLPEALRGLRTQLIPRRTREKLSHIPSPTTTPPHTFHGSNRQKLSSSSLFPFLHYALSSMSTQLFPLMRMFTIPPTRSVATLPLLFLFWTAHQDLSCALVAVPSLRHSSFFYNLHDSTFLPLQSLQYLSSAHTTFSFQGVRSVCNLPLIP